MITVHFCGQHKRYLADNWSVDSAGTLNLTKKVEPGEPFLNSFVASFNASWWESVEREEARLEVTAPRLSEREEGAAPDGN